jgi:hypothetical protein
MTESGSHCDKPRNHENSFKSASANVELLGAGCSGDQSSKKMSCLQNLT